MKDRSGMNRRCDENGGELGWNSDSVGGGSEGEGRWKKIGGLEKGDDVTEDGGDESIGIQVRGIEELDSLEERRDPTCLNGNADDEEVGVYSDLANEILGEEFEQTGSGVTGSRSDIIVISSDDEVDKKIVGTRDDRGKGNAIEKGFSQEIMQDLDLAEGITDTQDEEERDLALGIPNIYWSIEVENELVECLMMLANTTQKEPDLTEDEEDEDIKINEAAPRFEIGWNKEMRRRENAIRFRETAKDHALRLARANSPPRKHHLDSLEKNQELEIPSSMKLEDVPGPFSSALKAIRERNAKCGAQELIKWKPLMQQSSMIRNPIVPSLLDLSLRALTKNSEVIVSLDHVPDWLRQRFTTMLCDARKMNSHVLNRLLRDSPTEIRVKDCSWITDAQTCVMFGKLDTKNLRVLQLDLFGQCAIEDILHKSVFQSSNSLMCLRVISLRGACRLSDDLLKSLVTSAPRLQSVNVGQSSLLTCEGIKYLANSLAPSLRELYIDDCQKIDAVYITKSVSKFEHLEVLSVAGIESVSDEFVIYLAASSGWNMKELDIGNCGRLTDESLKAIGLHWPELQSINISNLNTLTDFGLLYLANGCRSVRKLKCCRNGFSDDAIAAFLEDSGESLEELSLNGVNKIGPSTALSLSKYSRRLLSLDLSWCRRISNEALGLVVDCCLSLKLLKIFGCTQITEIFLKGHSNPLVQIVGMNMTPILEHVNMLEPEGVVLRYSPISDDTH